MNDKDKEELEMQLSLTNPDVDVLEDFIYKLQAENTFLKENINGTRMKQMNERIEELLIENAKLRELVKDLAHNGMDYDIASRIEELDWQEYEPSCLNKNPTPKGSWRRAGNTLEINKVKK